jgi:hypothetical protein
MSYTIFYKQQFIKIDEQNVIPLILKGDDNVYTFAGKRARDWSNTLFFSKNIIISNEVLMQGVETYKENVIQACNENVERFNDAEYAYDEQRFGWHASIAIGGGRPAKTTFSAYKNFFAKGIITAKTIEELVVQNCTIQLKVYRWVDSEILDKGLEIKPNVMLSTTTQAVTLIKEYEEYYKGHNIFVYISAYGMENVEAPKKPKVKRQKVLVDKFFRIKTSSGYFIRFTKYGYKYGYFSGKAFRTEKAAQAVILKLKKLFQDSDFRVELVETEAYV